MRGGDEASGGQRSWVVIEFLQIWECVIEPITGPGGTLRIALEMTRA